MTIIRKRFTHVVGASFAAAALVGAMGAVGATGAEPAAAKAPTQTTQAAPGAADVLCVSKFTGKVIDVAPGSVRALCKGRGGGGGGGGGGVADARQPAPRP